MDFVELFQTIGAVLGIISFFIVFLISLKID